MVFAEKITKLQKKKIVPKLAFATKREIYSAQNVPAEWPRPCPAPKNDDCDGILTEARAFNLMFETYVGAVQSEENIAYLRAKQPLAPDGPIDADAVTDVALHLLSRESRMITGQVIAVDGGWSVSEPPPFA